MDMLKKLFPFSFGVKDVTDLVIKILVYVAVGVLVGLIGWVLGIIPLIGWILALVWGIVGTLVGLYTLAGIVFAVLDFCKILK